MLTVAAAPLRIPKALTMGGGMRSWGWLMRKFSRDRSVWAPQYLSPGTWISPKASLSVRVEAILKVVVRNPRCCKEERGWREASCGVKAAALHVGAAAAATLELLGRHEDANPVAATLRLVARSMVGGCCCLACEGFKKYSGEKMRNASIAMRRTTGKPLSDGTKRMVDATFLIFLLKELI